MKQLARQVNVKVEAEAEAKKARDGETGRSLYVMAKRALFFFLDIVDLGRDVYECQLLFDPPKYLRIRLWFDLLRPVSSLERSSQKKKKKKKTREDIRISNAVAAPLMVALETYLLSSREHGRALMACPSNAPTGLPPDPFLWLEWRLGITWISIGILVHLRPKSGC